MEWNGIEWNLMEFTGIQWNWMELNGMEFNGTQKHKIKRASNVSGKLTSIRGYYRRHLLEASNCTEMELNGIELN